MGYYLPKLRSQHASYHEPHSSHRYNNCHATTGCEALDYQTGGRTQVWPGDIRHNQPDQVLGIGPDDVAKAWRHYGETLRMEQGAVSLFDALGEGRCVMVPGFSGKLPNGFCSKSQRVEHNILAHPDRKGTLQRVADPYCKEPHWVWMERSALRAFYQTLGWSFGMTIPRKPK